MQEKNLIYVAWRLEAENDGTVIACRTGEGGSVETKEYRIAEASDWGELPSGVSRVVEQDGRRRGEWSA